MIAIPEDQMFGRFIAAGRMLAGLDQGQLAALAGVSASTISNIEHGRSSTPSSVKAIRQALRGKGVNLTIGNNLAMLGISFVDRNSAEDDE